MPATITKVADRGTHAALDATTTSTLTITSPTAITVGNYLIMRVAADNSGGSGAARTLTIPNSAAGDVRNAWTIGTPANSDPGAASAGVTVWVCYAKVVTAYQTSDVIILNWSGAIGANSEVLEEWSGIHATTPIVSTPTAQNNANAAGTTLATPVTGTPTAIGQLFYVAFGWEGIAGDTFTQDADSTGGTWVTPTSTASANATRTNNTRIVGGYKIVTSTAAQSYTPTGVTSSPIAAAAYIFDADPGNATASAINQPRTVTVSAVTGSSSNTVANVARNAVVSAVVGTTLNTVAAATPLATSPAATATGTTGVDPPGLSVSVVGTTATLNWTASPTGGVTGYDVFRRSPSTGAAFTPGTDTPIATGVTAVTYADTSLTAATYDWQVFGVVGAVGPWTPANLTATGKAWYDFADLASITASAGLVSSVADQYGGVAFTQATGSAQPTTGTRTIGGVNALDLQGDNLVRSAFDLSDGPWTMAFVFNTDSTRTGFNDEIMGLSGSSDGLWAGDQQKVGLNNVRSGAGVISPGIDYHMVVTTTAAEAVVVYLNGAVVASGTNTDPLGAFWQFNIGAGNGWLGKVGEALLDGQVWDATMVANWSGYVEAKWGIGWSPLNLSTVAWYDASDLTTITASSGAVSQWNDKSGNAYHLTQATGGLQPTTGTRTINGLNGIDLSGSHTMASNAPVGGVATRTAFAVMIVDTASDHTCVIGGSSFDSMTCGVTYITGNGAPFIGWLGESGQLNATAGLGYGTPGYAMWQHNGTARSLRVNGSAAGNDTGGQTSYAVRTFTFAYGTGTTWAFDGVIGELFWTEDVLDSTQIAQVEQYLRDKWTPTPVPGIVPVGWYDASDLSTITASSGAVSALADKSLSGFDLVQANSTKQPFTGTRTINGLNGLEFTGAGSVLRGAFALPYNTASMYVVMRELNHTYGRRAVTWQLGTANDYNTTSGMIVLGLSSGVQGSFYNNIDVAGGDIGLTFDNETFLYSWSRNGSVFTARKNGRDWPGSTGNTTTAFAPDSLSLGESLTDSGSQMVIAELLIFPTAHTTTQRDAVEQYLAYKWGLSPVLGVLPAAWYDASDTSTIVQSSGSVSAWLDKSGNARDLVQATGTSQPTTGVRTINGLNALDFYLPNNQCLANTAVGGIGGNAHTWWAVFSPDSTDSYSRVLSIYDTTASDYNSLTGISAIVRNASTSGWGIYYNSNIRANLAASNSPHLLVTQRVGDTTEVWLDDIDSGANSGIGTTDLHVTEMRIGYESRSSSGPFDGAIAEIGWCTTALDSTQRAALLAYARSKWGTP